MNDADLDTEKIKNIHKKYHLNYDIYYKGDALKKTLNVTAHPYTLIYNNQTNKVLYKKTGTNSYYEKEMNAVLDSLLK